MLYILRRLAWAALLLLAVTFITFVLSHVIPGDPATMMAGFGATRQAIQAMRAQMGLNQPLPLQYLQYLQGLSHLDFGTSVRTGSPVSSDLAHFLPATLELALISFGLYILLAIPPRNTCRRSPRPGCGRLISGYCHDRICRARLLAGAVVSRVFLRHLGWLPPGGRIDITASLLPRSLVSTPSTAS